MTVQIDLWLWPLDAEAREIAHYRAMLSPDEIARANRFVKPRDGARFAVGRGRLREVLGGYIGQAAKEIRFQTVAQKKPALAGGPAFNLSHSGGWAALAVAPDRADLALGIDIEAHRKIERDLPRRFFSQAEQNAMAALDPTGWQLGFFQTWTRKEAVIKATGDGLYADLTGFDVSLGPDVPARILRTTAPLPEASAWTLIDLETGPDVSGAIAAVTGGAPLSVVVREGQLPLPLGHLA